MKVDKPVEVYQASEPKPPPPGETVESGHYHGDEWKPSEPHETEVSGVASQPPKLEADAEGFAEVPPPIDTPADFVNPTRTSSNPLFKDGVPEHLQCPPELVGLTYRMIQSFDDEGEEKFIKILEGKIEPILDELEEKWVPDRPLSEVWYQIIDRYKPYTSDCHHDDVNECLVEKDVPWEFVMQILLDFPEILVLLDHDAALFQQMRNVELGLKAPDWNVAVLHDGRIFRLKSNYLYEFTFMQAMDVSNQRMETRYYCLGISENQIKTFSEEKMNAENIDRILERIGGFWEEIVFINLDEVSDNELERLGGWNFNINPYTTGAYKLGDEK